LVTTVAFGLASSAAVVIACADVADLGVSYEGRDAAPKTMTNDAAAVAPATTPDRDAGLGDVRQKVRPSSVVPVDASRPEPPHDVLFPCDVDGGAGEETGCNTSAGLGCCISPLGATCMGQGEARTTCAGLGSRTLFIACVQGQGDSACCWHTGANGHRTAAYGADCSDGGTVACIDDNGCPADQKCVTTQCGTAALTIGECGREPECL
jgi:hypothetical protein